MPSPEALHRVLQEEETALELAARLRHVADLPDHRRLDIDLAALKAYLTGDLELHLAREECEIFPRLRERGLEAEVDEARRQHDELRELRASLLAADASAADLSHRLRALGEALGRHVHFEADFLYVDLTRTETRRFRDRLVSARARAL